MPTNLRNLFNPELRDLGKKGSARWCQEIFGRAYCGAGFPFDDVVRKLRAGFSVLVYLPGTCMTAAAEFVQPEIPGEWMQFGKIQQGADVVALWDKTTGIFERLASWFDGSASDAPQAIYHNLDLLADDRGGMYGHPFAHNALFSLLETTRTGTVLGLADRSVGELPARVTSCFSDVVTLRQIPLDGFARILPLQLGKVVSEGRDVLSDATLRLIWARLRWSDPIQAVRLMLEVAGRKRDLAGVLTDIAMGTRPVDYLPSEALTGLQDDIKGYDQEVTLDDIQNMIIGPYRRWGATQARGGRSDTVLAAKLQPGLILHGPPGTGKTTLARWIAKSIGWPIRVTDSGELKRGVWGETERLVNKLFFDARRASPCVLVLDDADDLLPSRDELRGSVASAEIGIVNAFLKELEGFGGVLEGVLVILTTNRFESIDKAIRDRLSLHVLVPFPLDDRQVGEIVDATAHQYGYTLTDPIRELLIREFLAHCVVDGAKKERNASRADRLRCVNSLFSPRLIARSMLHLERGEGESYQPTEEDVRRMKAYLTRQVI